MANVEEEVAKIASAKYGRDVRSSICSAILAMNDESSEAISKADTAQDSASASAQSALDSKNAAKTSENNAKEYADEAKAAVTGIYHFKGSVQTRDDLPATPSAGDVYDIISEGGQNVAWTGTKWDELGATVDLSAYLTKTDASTSYATKTELAGKGDSMTYDENSSTLLLKSGNTILSSVHIEGGSVATIVHIDTHETSWFNNPNVTIDVNDGEEDIDNGHFDENGDYVAKVHHIGTYTVTVTDEDGQTYITTFADNVLGQVLYVYVDKDSCNIVINGTVTLAPEMDSSFTVPSGYYKPNSVSGFQVQIYDGSTLLETKTFSGGMIGVVYKPTEHSTLTIKASAQNGFTTPADQTVTLEVGTTKNVLLNWVEQYSTLTVTTEESELYGKEVTVTDTTSTLKGSFNATGDDLTFILKSIATWDISCEDAEDSVDVSEFGSTDTVELSLEFDFLTETVQSEWTTTAESTQSWSWSLNSSGLKYIAVSASGNNTEIFSYSPVIDFTKYKKLIIKGVDKTYNSWSDIAIYDGSSLVTKVFSTNGLTTQNITHDIEYDISSINGTKKLYFRTQSRLGGTATKDITELKLK